MKKNKKNIIEYVIEFAWQIQDENNNISRAESRWIVLNEVLAFLEQFDELPDEDIDLFVEKYLLEKKVLTNWFDSIQNLRAEDSFIHRKNKLKSFIGNGEARKYVGSYLSSSGDRLSDFFEYKNWGQAKENGKRIYPIIQKDNCFFSKTNLLKYLYDTRIEY